MKFKKTVFMTLATAAALMTTPVFASETTNKIADTKNTITKTEAVLKDNKNQTEDLSKRIEQQAANVSTTKQRSQAASEATKQAAKELAEAQKLLNTANAVYQTANVNSADYALTTARKKELEETVQELNVQLAEKRTNEAASRTASNRAEKSFKELTEKQEDLVEKTTADQKKLTTKQEELKKLEAQKQQEEKAAAEKAKQEEAAALKAAAEAAANQPRGIDHSDSGNAYSWGQCTWYVKTVAPWVGTYWGNGADWGYSAAADGYRVDSSPEAGAVVVFAAGQQGASAQYGHVGYVESVNSDGTFTFSQGGMGFASPAGPNYQTLSAAGLQFIHKN